MPSAASPAIDSDNKTVVPPTPSERATMTPVPKSSSGKAHFNASLDMALQLLQKQTVEDLSSSATPEPSLPRAQTKAFPAQYAATPDDLISADTPFSDTPTCCNSHASSVSLGEQSNVKSAELDVEKTQRVEAECQVRARIPYPGGHFYLHVFHTDEDDKEHLAMVFGDDIRSASLEHTRAGESDMDRKIRGASTGALRRLVGQDIAQRGLAPPSPPDMDMFTFEPDPAEQFAASRVSVVDAPLVRMHS
ncbi:GTP cyclohydrolase II, partial [Coemansia sp. RSA 2610]